MSGETMELIETLKLNEATTDQKLSSARDFALRCLRSKAPIPQTVMTVVERSASHSDATYTAPTVPPVDNPHAKIGDKNA